MELQPHDQLWAETVAAENARERSRARARIYRSRAVTISKATLPRELRRDVAHLFEEMKSAVLLGNRKIAEKKKFFGRLLFAGLRASYYGGCVRFPRNFHHPECSKLRLGVVGAAVDFGLFEECRSLPGSPRESRLVPRGVLTEHPTIDPWEFDPETTSQYVFLSDRENQEELPFDPLQELPAEIQRRLERINDINGLYKITHRKWDEWAGDFTTHRRLRPVHYARFTDDFDHHGRIYTRRYGHQGLRKVERATIEFNGQPSVELDYRGMHPRMLYHPEGIAYTSDPYALWGDATTEQQRLMAKKLVNALINAPSQNAAVAACNRAMSSRTNDGKMKQGKALQEARKLRDAYKAAGFKFRDMVPVVLNYHRRIDQYFGSDMGMKLMRIDSAIALDILDHFAELGVPCLACHDSFIVPKRARDELSEVMHSTYLTRVGFMPQIR